MEKQTVLVAVTLIVGMVLIAGCLEGPTGPQGLAGENAIAETKTIVGIWEPYPKESVFYPLTLRENGTHTYAGKESGTYIVEGNKLTLTYKSSSGDVHGVSEYEYLLSSIGDRLSIKKIGQTRYKDFVRISD